VEFHNPAHQRSTMSTWDAEYSAETQGRLPSLLDRLANDTVADGIDEDETALGQLIRHWQNERHAPDILPTQDDLLVGLLDHIRKQSETIQLLRLDPGSSEEEHIRIMLAQTEVERVKFIVRSYLRTRLFKVFASLISLNTSY
jgi:hypothetical protein